MQLRHIPSHHFHGAHMKRRLHSALVAFAILLSTQTALACENHDAAEMTEAASVQSAKVIAHDAVKTHTFAGNSIRGVATASQGAKEFEVWLTSLPPGSRTPTHHKHETEETFVFTQGEGTAVVGDTETPFKAPCTVVMPANVKHHIINTGKVPTQATVIVGVGSKIYNSEGKLMDLPWRK
jgi:mannose-6-phosphate isomerase-like protein (cupin superfamily)